jgi:hypothetical protein
MFRSHVDSRPGARIAPGARRPRPDGKGPETAQLNATAGFERDDHAFEDDAYDPFDIALGEMRVLRREGRDQL